MFSSATENPTGYLRPNLQPLTLRYLFFSSELLQHSHYIQFCQSSQLPEILFRACVSACERKEGKNEMISYFIGVVTDLSGSSTCVQCHIFIWDETVFLISDLTSALPCLKTCSVARQVLLPCETEDEIGLPFTYSTGKLFHPASCNNYVWDGLHSSVLKSKTFSFSKPKSMEVAFILFTCFQQSHYSRYCLRRLKKTRMLL